MTGFVVAAFLGVWAFAAFLAITRGVSRLGVLAEPVSLLSLLPLLIAAAVGGAALGGLRRRNPAR